MRAIRRQQTGQQVSCLSQPSPSSTQQPEDFPPLHPDTMLRMVEWRK